mgnify:CR=1 FL=1
MRVRHSTQRLPGQDGTEVHVIDVHGTAHDLLCRLFVQPTEQGCQVQVESSGARLRVAALEDLVLVGVRTVTP